MEEAYKILLEKLIEARLAAEMRQEDLAAAMGVKQSTISDVLSGKKRMGRKTLGAVLRVFPHLRPQVIAVLVAEGNAP